jgi:tetratricopeptide (TPR) repeat protein
LAEAFADIKEARRGAPEDPTILNAYGLCAARLGRLEEAFAAFEAAAAADPGFAQVHFNLAWAAEMLGELDRAHIGYRRAVELSPNAAEAWANLAWLCARTAAWNEARSTAERAIALLPEAPLPRFALAMAELNTGDTLAAERSVRQALALPNIGRNDQGIGLGLLGDCLDRQNAVDAAFEAYQQSNAVFRDEYAAQIASRTTESVFSMVSWLAEYFARESPDSWTPRATSQSPGMGEVAHVFLVGFPRSGTTLLEQVLASHPAIASMDEKEALAAPVQTFMRTPASLHRLRDAADSDIAQARSQYWKRVRDLKFEPAGKIFVDKLALNTIKLPLIARLFPHAKILVALRDPRDVVWGCFRQRFQMNAAMLEFTSLEGTAQLYDRCMTLLQTYRRVLPLDVLEVRNENLVARFDEEAKRICAFIGAPWDEAMRSFSERRHTRAISTPSSVQVARGLYASGGQWKPYERHLQPILPIVQPWVERFGYGGT